MLNFILCGYLYMENDVIGKITALVEAAGTFDYIFI